MLCPVCNRPSRVVASEPFGEGGVRHTRLCTAPTSHAHAGALFHTHEVPAGVVVALGPRRVLEVLRTLRRGLERRAAAAERRRVVLDNPRMPAAQLARRLNVTEARVRQYRAEQ